MLDLWGSFSTDLGVDLGTDHTRICLRDEGIVLDEPTAAAVDLRQGKILALGREARQMLGRTPEGIQVVRPLQNGVIASFDLTRRMLKGFLRQALGKRPLFRPRLVLSVPCGVNSVERRAVLDAAMEAGAGEAYLLEAPLAAALGAGIPVRETKSCLVVDMGAGATEAAVLTGVKVVDLASAHQAAQVFLNKGVRNVIITLGGNGVYCTDGTREELVERIPVQAVDTTGAGDTFCGYFLTGLCQQQALADCLKSASAAAAIAVSRAGAAPSIPTRDEVEVFLRNQ